MKLPKNIEAMIGRSFVYNGRTIEVQSITKKDEDMFLVRFNGTFRDLEMDEDELKNDLKPVVSVELTQAESDVRNTAVNSVNSMDALADALMATLQTVKNDPGYIDQARAINSTAREIIKVRKTQIEAMKLMKDIIK